MTLRRSWPCSRLQSKRWPLPPLAVVEQVLVDMAERTGREGFADAQRFPDADVVREGVAQRVDIGLVFITVQLHGGQPQSLRAGDHLLQRRIAEDADVLRSGAAAITALAWASFTARGEVGTKISPP